MFIELCDDLKGCGVVELCDIKQGGVLHYLSHAIWIMGTNVKKTYVCIKLEIHEAYYL